MDRLEAHGRPYVVVHFGLERDVLAYHGCAELFQVCPAIFLDYTLQSVIRMLHD